MDPILQAAQTHVAALPALTQPFSTSFASEYAYFRSGTPHFSTIRTDGKRISFVNYYHKTNINEDIAFLRACIMKDPHGPFTEVTGEEIEQAEAIIDPKASMERKIRSKILAELQAQGVDLSKVSVEKVAGAAVSSSAEAAASSAIADDTRIAGVDAGARALQKLAALRTGQMTVTPLTNAQVPVLTPVSSTDIAAIAGASGGMNAPANGGASS